MVRVLPVLALFAVYTVGLTWGRKITLGALVAPSFPLTLLAFRRSRLRDPPFISPDL